MVVENLYRCETEESVSVGFTFDESVIRAALRRIYKGDLDSLHDIEENLFNETWTALNKAAQEGYVPISADDDFIDIIKQNNAVFSAFKVHRLQNDIAAQLLDEKGNLKSFERFSTDVQPITDHQCKRWLRTEYNTAVIRSHKATQWRQFLREKDIFPNIEWLPSSSIHPREVHRAFWGLILPIEHPFWSEHQPGDDWNCKCGWAATDEEPTTLPEGWKRAAAPSPGLNGNPGVTGKLFSKTHPYIAKGHRFAKEAVEKFIANLLKKEAKANISKLKLMIDKYEGHTISKRDSVNGKIIILQSSFKQIIEHGGNKVDILRLLSKFNFNEVDNWEYIGWAPHNTPHAESEYVTYYKFTFMEKTYYSIMRMHKHYGCEVLHTIKHKLPDDIIKGMP